MTEIFRVMGSVQVAILCITRDNVLSPWISFEAGALAFREAPVIPYLADLSLVELSGPLVAFQALTADREGTLLLLHTINQHLEQPLAEDRLLRVFEIFWPEFENTLRKLPEAQRSAAERGPQENKRSEHDLLEEILAIVRESAKAIQSLRELDSEI